MYRALLIMVALALALTSATAPTPTQFLTYAKYVIDHAASGAPIIARLGQSNSLAYLRGLVAA